MSEFGFVSDKTRAITSQKGTITVDPFDFPPVPVHTVENSRAHVLNGRIWGSESTLFSGIMEIRKRIVSWASGTFQLNLFQSHLFNSINFISVFKLRGLDYKLQMALHYKLLWKNINL